MQQYEGTILPKNSEIARQRLGNKLLLCNSAILEKRTSDDKRKVMNSFPKLIKAIVIHRRLLISDNFIGDVTIDNIAIEVTLLGTMGDPVEEYKEALFSPMSVYQWVCKSKNSLVTHLL